MFYRNSEITGSQYVISRENPGYRNMNKIFYCGLQRPKWCPLLVLEEINAQLAPMIGCRLMPHVWRMPCFLHIKDNMQSFHIVGNT